MKTTKTKFNFALIMLVCALFLTGHAMGHSPSIIDSGAADPGGPSTGEEFYRTDLNKHRIYDGTQWLDQELGYYNVKAYGAIGNGTTDDTNAIQAAIDAVPSTGGVVFLPVGVYKLTDTIDLKSNIVFRGALRKE